MPNHITNIVTIYGDAERVKELFSFVKSEESKFDFNKIIPMPDSLNISSGSNVDQAIIVLENDVEELRNMMDWNWVKEMKVKNEEELRKKLLEKLSPEDLNEGKIALENIKNYGHKDWYSWRLAYWGTKWNAYEVNQDSSLPNQIVFDTAWATPFPVIEKLAKTFSDLKIEVKFADEDIGSNCGIYSFEQGMLVEEFLPKGWEAFKFAIETKNSFDEEYIFGCMSYYLTNNDGESDNHLLDDVEKYIVDSSVRDEFLNCVLNNCSNKKSLEIVSEKLKQVALNNEIYEAMGLIDKISSEIEIE
jgi:hypothetical protein